MQKLLLLGIARRLLRQRAEGDAARDFLTNRLLQLLGVVKREVEEVQVKFSVGVDVRVLATVVLADHVKARFAGGGPVDPETDFGAVQVALSVLQDLRENELGGGGV